MNAMMPSLPEIRAVSAETLDWAHAYGGPVCNGSIKISPVDFQVDESLPFTPSGEGEHVYLRVRKSELNTEDCARKLAQCAGVPKSAVGYAGMKDRQAQTTQWFSVWMPTQPEPDWSTCQSDQLEILQICRHGKKLKRGWIRANAFSLTLRDLTGEPALIEARLRQIESGGVPNYFGPQRFGHQGRNVGRAGAFFAGQIKVRSRHQKGLMYSSARSWLFNQVLHARVLRGDWNQAISGDVMSMSGSRQYFIPDQVDDEIRSRIAARDICPSGPMPGKGESPVAGAAAELEQLILGHYPDFMHGLLKAGVEQARRPLVLWIDEFQFEWLDPKTLRLQFELPPGSYATAVVRELIQTEDGAEQIWS